MDTRLPGTGRRAADHYPPVDPRFRRRINRWAAGERLLITSPRERWYDFVSIFRSGTPDLVSSRLLEEITRREGFLSGNPYAFSLATTLSAIRALSRVLLGVPQQPTRAATAKGTSPAEERREPGERLFASLRKADPFALELLSRLAREDDELMDSLRFLELSHKKRAAVRVEQLSRVARATFALRFITEQLSPEVLSSVLGAVRETARSVGYTGQRGVSVEDAGDILRVCIENLQRFTTELYPVALKATGRFYEPDDTSEDKRSRLYAFAGITSADVLSREVFQEALRKRREAENARQEAIALETVQRGEESKIASAFGTTLRIIGTMFPDSGMERIEQTPYLLPYFDNRVFARNLPFDHGTHSIEAIARHDPFQTILVLHRIMDNLLTAVNPLVLESVLDRHGLAESFSQISTDWTTAYDALLVPYLRAVNEYRRELDSSGSATGPVVVRLTEEIAQMRNQAIKGYGATATARSGDGLRLWSLAERLTLLLELVGEEINSDIAKRDDPVAKRIYRAIGMEPVFEFAGGGDEQESVQRPVIRQLRRYVEARFKSGLSSVPRVAQLFAIDFLRALAELYRFLLNDERSPLRSAGAEVLLAGREEAAAWEQERASRSGTMDDRLRIRLDEFSENAFTDALTGLKSKEFFLQKLPGKFASIVKTGGPVSVLMIDLDHFKWVNDSLGHQTGDLVLKDATATVADGVRRGQDLAIRYGGEELLVLLPAPLSTAAGLAERMRAAQEAHVHERELYEQIQEIGSKRGESCGTFSIGVIERASGESLEACVERADKALYAAKKKRNAVSIGRLVNTKDAAGQRAAGLVHEGFAEYVARVRRSASRSER